ncbi:MAG: glycerol-3-phosphate acyltransferase [Lachnospiraceae bacterium]|nr:glycerol-3-phosphate acyltransferase [Lachnospiraceae bacterium]
MIVAVRFFCLAIGLIFGLFQTGYIVGKANGIDLRNYGSGNSGTTNAVRVLGTGKGLLVLAGDAAKTLLAMLIVYYTFGNMYPEMKLMLCMYAALGAVISHDFPFYMHFKGGKGIACTAGYCIGLCLFNPLIFIITFFVFLIPFLITHYVSLGSLMVYLALVIEVIIFGQNGWLGYDYSQSVLIEIYVIMFILAGLAYYLHRKNIVRLIKGEENKTYLLKKHRDAYNAEKAAKEAAKNSDKE